MGLVPFWRNLLRIIARRAFFPGPGATWPDVTRLMILVHISDINSLIRKKQLAVSYNGTRAEYGFRKWGDFVGWLGREYSKFFAEGVKTLYVVFDGKTPDNKGVEQHDRKDSWQNGLSKADNKPYEWPVEDDGKPWFTHDADVFCSFNDIYYGCKLAKRKFYEYISNYLLYEMPLPPDCKVVVDCGALPGIGMLRRPTQARIEHYCDDTADAATIRDTIAIAERSGFTCNIKRIVEDVPGELDYCTYTEADDRMIYFVYKETLDDSAPKNVIVGSEDGDTMIALMATYPTRRSFTPNGRPCGKVYLRRSQIISYLVDSAGVKTKVEQPEWIDTDLLAQYIEDVFDGILAAGIRTEGDYRKLENCAPIALYCMLSVMCECDYVEGFRGLSAVNILRGLVARPDLARAVLAVKYPDRDRKKRPMDEAKAPDVCLIHAESMIQFVAHCYSIAHQNHVSPKSFPVPPPETIRAITARIAWTLDKAVNAGRPEYRISFPFMISEDTQLPVFGYDVTEVYDEKEGRKKKRPRFSPQVDARPFYGVVVQRTTKDF